MDLKLVFEPVLESLYENIEDNFSFCRNITINKGTMPEINAMDLAIIGITETRGGDVDTLKEAPDAIRQKLYSLKKGQGRNRIVDLGNLRSGVDLEETYNRVREVCLYLMNKDIMPILIGGTHDIDLGQFQAYGDANKMIGLVNIDAFLDMEAQLESAKSKHIHQILVHEPNYLFNYNIVGYQAYLNNIDDLTVLENMYFETYGLGIIRNDMMEIEPVMRSADMLTFDLNAIKSIDAPANDLPFGLSGEEACQLCWYAGMNEQLSSAGFYEFDPNKDDSKGSTAFVVSTMIWYLIEGFYNRKDSAKFDDGTYTKYTVNMSNDGAEVVFYRSNKTEKWWLEVSYPGEEEKKHVTPCSYKDFQMANDGELPMRWVNAHAKLI